MTDDRLLFSFLRRELGSLSQAKVDEFNAVLREWKRVNGLETGATGPTPAQPLPKGLKAPEAFYGALRTSFGALDQKQVDGFNALLSAMGAAGWPIAYVAYGLATAWHETAHTMQPVEEAFWKDDAWRKRNLRYYPWHGRGYVQLTWEGNYRRADDELGLGGALVADARKAMEPDIAAKILVRGMESGWFTNKSLSLYLPAHGPGDHRQFTLARYIINGTDKASAIADLALKFQAALQAGEWS